MRRALPALAAGLVLADSSVVTLALPEILRALDATVAGVAWVLISFNLALALAAVPAARLAPRPAYVGGLVVFAAACLVCASAESLGVLIAGRVAQGVAGAAVVAAALALARVGEMVQFDKAAAVPAFREMLRLYDNCMVGRKMIKTSIHLFAAK
ncbi:MAG: MFS transporter, partial [Baekduiaceae bacterium]